MATPNSSFNELLSTTIQDLEPDMIEQILLANAFTAGLKEYGGMGTRDGGPQIVQPIEFAENGSYRRYTGSDILNTSQNDVFSSYNFPWAQVALTVSITGREMLQNSGRSGRFNLLKSRITNAKRTFANQFNADCLSDGSATNQVQGLQVLIAPAGTGTVGGISRASYSFAKNAFYRCTTDGGAAVTPGNIVSYMDALDLQLRTYHAKTDFIIADDTMFRYFEGTVHPMQRLNPVDGKVGKLGFGSYAYKNSEVVFEPVAGGMPASTQYWIDCDAIELVAHADRNLVQLDDRNSFNQDMSLAILAWMGALVGKNFRRLGTLNNN